MKYYTAENFCWTKISLSLAIFVYIFGGIKFHQCGKGCHILYVFMNMGQKVRG